jgi:glucose/arabinose dehydrogenase
MKEKLLLVIPAFILYQFSYSQTGIKLVEQSILLKKKLAFTLKIPQGYKINVAAEGLGRPRFFAKSPDGRLFITDMYDRSDNKKGKVIILGNWNDKEKKFDTVITFLEGLHNPNQVIFYAVNNEHFLYVTETDKLSYYKYIPGDNKHSSPPTVITGFPDYGLNYKYGWPYYFQYRKQILIDPAFKDSVHPAYTIKPPVARWGFKAHSAPLGFEFLSSFSDPALNNSFIVALHGSTSVWRQRGNVVVQMMLNGTYRDIVTGFLQGKTENKRFGRPCDIFQWNNNSFFISDDKNGVIYYIWKEN